MICKQCGEEYLNGKLPTQHPSERISALERENKRLREALRRVYHGHADGLPPEDDEKFRAEIQALLAKQPASAQQGGGE